MRPSILTVISLKMWSLHLLQTALRFGGNLKMVCGWCGNKFVECDWKGFTDSWVFIIIHGSSVLWSWPLTDLLPEALTSHVLPTRKQSFMLDQRILQSSFRGSLRGRWAGAGGGRGKALNYLRSSFFHKNVASFILINPKWKGSISPHHYHHLPSMERKLNNSKINKH